MKRFDLRHLHRDFLGRMEELINEDILENEVGIFLFEVGDFTPVHEAHDLIKRMGHDLLNSLKFAEPDWTIVVRKLPKEQARQNATHYLELQAQKASEAAQESEA